MRCQKNQCFFFTFIYNHSIIAIKMIKEIGMTKITNEWVITIASNYSLDMPLTVVEAFIKQIDMDKLEENVQKKIQSGMESYIATLNELVDNLFMFHPVLKKIREKAQLHAVYGNYNSAELSGVFNIDNDQYAYHTVSESNDSKRAKMIEDARNYETMMIWARKLGHNRV